MLLMVWRLLALPLRPSPVRLRVPSTIRRNLSGGPEGPAIIVRSAIVGVGSFPPGRDAETSRGSRGKDPDSRTGSACFRRGPRSSRSFPSSSASADPVGACLRRVSKSGRSLSSSSASASAGGCPSGFSLARGTPFPSGPGTFRRGVAAFVPSRTGYKNPVCFSKACAPIRSGFLASDPWMLRFETESRKPYLSTLSTGPAGTVDNQAEGFWFLCAKRRNRLAIPLREQP